MHMARLNQLTDQSLAIALQHGDLDSLAQIMKKYHSPLLRYANYLGSGENDEDVVQETFIKVYKNIQGYDPSKSFSSWIYRIAHNTTISMIRKNKFSIPWEEYLDNFVSQDPIDNIDKDLKKEQVAKCIDKLPLHYKAPLALYYMEDKSYEEIMDILRLPRGTVAARINRAKKQMRNLCQKN